MNMMWQFETGKKHLFPWPGKSCHEIMEIPQNKTRGKCKHTVCNDHRGKAKSKSRTLLLLRVQSCSTWKNY